ncbi:hypothetical protein BDV12DRAFT_179389 [Aspergillus spectabilis]
MSPATSDERLWLQATTFTDLVELNMKFLRNEISSTPYHCGPLEEETRGLIKSLLKLHEKNIKQG